MYLDEKKTLNYINEPVFMERTQVCLLIVDDINKNA